MANNLINRKFYFTIFLLGILISSTMGQSSGSLKVIRKYYDIQKTRLMEVYTINSIGQRQGLYNFYNAFSVTTSPEFIAEYKNDMLDGQRTRYYTFAHTSLSGIIKETCEYKENKKNGKEVLYDYVYNGRYTSKGMDEDKEVEHIQKGKRVIREESIYLMDILLSYKSYHPNGKIEVNQKYRTNGNLIFEIVTNDVGVITAEQRYDDDENGFLLKKFVTYSNGKVKETIQRDSIGFYQEKEYYETGELKKERYTNKSDKTLSETNYWENGKLKYRKSELSEETFSKDGIPQATTTTNLDGETTKEEFFDDASIKKKIVSDKKGNIKQHIQYKNPKKIDFDYLVKNDTSFYKKYNEDNLIVFTEIENNKNGVVITETKNGGKLLTYYNKISQGEYYPTDERDKKIILIREIDPKGNKISESSTKENVRIKKEFNTIGGYVESTTEINSNMFGEKSETLKSIKEVDSTGASKIFQYDFSKKIIAKRIVNSAGRLIFDSTANYLVKYDSIGSKTFEKFKNFDKWNQYWFNEYRFESDGYVRKRQFYESTSYYNSAGTLVTQSKYPDEMIFKRSKKTDELVHLGTVEFDEKGNKVKLFVFDLSGNQIKVIKIKDGNENQYFNLFQTVD